MVDFSISEFSIFGSKRIGVVTNPEQLTQPVIDPPAPYSCSFRAGMKQYEFNGNFIQSPGPDGFIDYYTAQNSHLFCNRIISPPFGGSRVAWGNSGY